MRPIKQTIYIYDVFPGVTVVTVSPKPSRTKEILKRSKNIRLFMPLWTLEELQQYRELLYPHIPVATVDHAFYMDRWVGGLRRTFSKSLV